MDYPCLPPDYLLLPPPTSTETLLHLTGDIMRPLHSVTLITPDFPLPGDDATRARALAERRVVLAGDRIADTIARLKL